MINQQIPDLLSLLARGYFPRELPPPFSTESFAWAVTNSNLSMPHSFTSANRIARLSPHDIPNLGLRRRVTALPNPVLHFNLCKALIAEWLTINVHCQSSTLSNSSPIFSLRGRTIGRKLNEDALPPIRARNRSLSKYLLKADISRFYPSLYTHSIPWALHTKPVAKKSKKQKQPLLGDVIDRWVRNGQDAQTIGIPIGPDTSLIISEIVLSAFDADLKKRLPNYHGFRYIDDFEIGFKSYSEAEEGLAVLRSTLHEYELDVNAQKTTIRELPIPLNPAWVSSLREHSFNGSRRKQNTQLHAYFDKALEYSLQYPTDHVLKYALSTLSRVTIKLENWEALETFLFQCIMAESNTFMSALNILKKYSDTGHPIDLISLEELMNYQISHRCYANHGNEVGWALWALMYWGRKVNKEAAIQISRMSDPVVALTALDAYHRGLIPIGLDLTYWEQIINEPDTLYSSSWLLSYESIVKGWLNPKLDPISKDPNFEHLRSNGVEFYQLPRVTKVNMISFALSDLTIPTFSF